MGLPLSGTEKRTRWKVLLLPTEINPVYAFGLLTYNEKKAIKNIFILFMIIN